MQRVILARRDGGPGAECDGRRQDESVVVVGMLANQIHTARSAKDVRRSCCKSSGKLFREAASDSLVVFALRHGLDDRNCGELEPTFARLPEDLTDCEWSGRPDSNREPLAPKPAGAISWKSFFFNLVF